MRNPYKLIQLVILSACALSAQPSDDVANGKMLFETKYRCYSCHDHEGIGGMGPRLVTMKLPSAAFIAYVRNPRRMPAFSSKVIPDADLSAIWSYLKSLKESPSATEIPLLREILAH